jgi:hypothetical protein
MVRNFSFSTHLSVFGIKVGELTGDSQITKQQISRITWMQRSCWEQLGTTYLYVGASCYIWSHSCLNRYVRMLIDKSPGLYGVGVNYQDDTGLIQKCVDIAHNHSAAAWLRSAVCSSSLSSICRNRHVSYLHIKNQEGFPRTHLTLAFHTNIQIIDQVTVVHPRLECVATRYQASQRVFLCPYNNQEGSCVLIEKQYASPIYSAPCVYSTPPTA